MICRCDTNLVYLTKEFAVLNFFPFQILFGHGFGKVRYVDNFIAAAADADAGQTFAIDVKCIIAEANASFHI